MDNFKQMYAEAEERISQLDDEIADLQQALAAEREAHALTESSRRLQEQVAARLLDENNRLKARLAAERELVRDAETERDYLAQRYDECSDQLTAALERAERAEAEVERLRRKAEAMHVDALDAESRIARAVEVLEYPCGDWEEVVSVALAILRGER